MTSMWRATVGHPPIPPKSQQDDDWETDPDFVVRGNFFVMW